MANRPHRLLLSLLIALPLAPAALHAQDEEIGPKVEQLLSRMENTNVDRLWDSVAQLEKLGPAAVADIAKGLERTPLARLGSAKALLVMDGGDAYRSPSIQALRDLVFSQSPRAVRTMAADLLLAHSGKSDQRSLRKRINDIDDAFVKVAVLKGLRSFGRRKLKEFLKSDDPALRAEAALALAETGNIEAAKDELDQLKYEPTDRGRRARLYIDQDRMLERLRVYGGLQEKEEIIRVQQTKITRLQKDLEKLRAKLDAGGGGGEGRPGRQAKKNKTLELIEEILQKVQDYYVDEKKIKESDLGDAAVKGLVEDLDPFSSYMTEDETKAFQESIRQSYAGIGAVVQTDPRTNFLTIVRPIYGGPAFETGLRTLDRIVEVEGVSTKGKSVRDLVKVLKGKAGTEVMIKVEPFLGPKGERKDVAIVRRSVSLPSVSYEMLPGGLGYIQLSQFGYRAVAEVSAAVDDLERRGMNSLIFDLRGNPGGLLTAAVQIAEMFLPKDKLIVYQQGRKGTVAGQRKEFRTKQDSKYPNFPMVVLLDENSASASEIVSGALKVHKRATVIGKQSFGKGSVQQLYNVRSTEGKSLLRLTIAYYYLPDGTCIHRDRSSQVWRFRETLETHIARWREDGIVSEKQAEQLSEMYKPTAGGVDPHITVEREDLSKEVRLMLGELQGTMIVENFVRERYAEHQKLFHRLAVYDAEDPTLYPGFAELMKKIDAKLAEEKEDAKLEQDHVRRYLRMTVRRFVQDDLGRTFPSDFQGDLQLERGIFEALRQCGLKPGDFKEYARLTERCEAAIEKEKAAAKEAEQAEKKG